MCRAAWIDTRLLLLQHLAVSLKKAGKKRYKNWQKSHKTRDTPVMPWLSGFPRFSGKQTQILSRPPTLSHPRSRRWSVQKLDRWNPLKVQTVLESPDVTWSFQIFQIWNSQNHSPHAPSSNLLIISRCRPSAEPRSRRSPAFFNLFCDRKWRRLSTKFDCSDTLVALGAFSLILSGESWRPWTWRYSMKRLL